VIIEHLPVSVILVYCIAALLMPMARMVHKSGMVLTALSAAFLAVGCSILTLIKTLEEGVLRYSVGGWAPPIGIELVADPLSAFFLLVVNLVAAVVLSQSVLNTKLASDTHTMSFQACQMLMLAGFSGIIGTGDLFNLFVFLELSALASYAVLGNGSGRAAHSTFRYLIIGTIGASFYLFGLGFLYAETGSLNMGDVSRILALNGMGMPAQIAFSFIVIGIWLKMALLPLHQWLPDVYTDAPAMSTALVAPIGTKVAVYVLLRMLYGVFPGESALGILYEVLCWAGAVAIIWGSVMAIPQNNFKRMLAYSSVAQIGYIVLGIGMATPFGFIGAVLHVFNHALMKACLFLFSARVESSGSGTDLDQFSSRVRLKFPVATACFTVAAISMIGLPPTAGFFSKWYLLLGSYSNGDWIFIAVILVSSLLNAVYFFRLIEKLYLKTPESESAEDSHGAQIRPSRKNLGMLIFAISILISGLFNVWIVRTLIEPMLPSF
jgi:multicomponent Na+:H+ antiporter subunit D